MNILILGSGGREHAFAIKIKQSPLCGRLFVSPGNGGTANIATNVVTTDFWEIRSLVLTENIELMIVGSEEYLVKGIVDFFKNDPELASVKVIGPDKAGARLEGSKDFSKAFMLKYEIPTAQAATFGIEQLEEGLAYLSQQAPPFVLKADGLAGGKGVIITDELSEARQQLKEMLVDAKFGQASKKVLIEEFLKGIELSVFVLTDGKNYHILPEAKDYKRIGEGDIGLNTGGMGAVSPVPFADPSFMKKVEIDIVEPTLKGLKSEGIDYKGFIFIGLMNDQGQPRVIEYNVRMGDPETEVVLPRIDNDLVELMLATANQTLDQTSMVVNPKTAVTTVVVAGGYPEGYKKGDPIRLPDLSASQWAFHAGTKKTDEFVVLTDGGRVMALTAMASTLPDAIEKSQDLAEKVQYNNKYFRKDIGQDLLAYV